MVIQVILYVVVRLYSGISSSWKQSFMKGKLVKIEYQKINLIFSMCFSRNRRACVIGVTVFCILITAISSLNMIPGIAKPLAELEAETYGDHLVTILSIKIVIYLIILLCQISCLIGAITRRSLLLIPVMVIGYPTMIVVSTIGAGLFLYFGGLTHYLQGEAKLLIVAAVIYSCQWIFVYFVYLVYKLYKEIQGEKEEDSGIIMNEIHSKI